MKTKKIKRVAFAILVAVLVSIGVKSYATCIECLYLPNSGQCYNNVCSANNNIGPYCCGNSL